MYVKDIIECFLLKGLQRTKWPSIRLVRIELQASNAEFSFRASEYFSPSMPICVSVRDVERIPFTIIYNIAIDK